MSSQKIYYDRIDSGIKDLVHTLEQIPYISPIEDIMCEGHLGKTACSTYRPENGHIFIFSANVGFFVDESYSDALPFLEEVRSLRKKYHFLDIDQHHCAEDCKMCRAKKNSGI